MDEEDEEPDEEPREPRRSVRFEATVHPGEAQVEFAALTRRVADLDLDRIPDPEGQVRLLVDADECAQLLDQGFEVRLRRAVPIRPLDQRLVADDEDVRAWFDERTRGTGQAG